MSKLSLRYQFDPSFFDPKQTRDDFGRLSVLIETDRFSANGGFWVQWQDIEEFGEALAAFPLTADAPVVAQWGFNMQEGDDLILRIEIAPANSRGDLVVRYEVADDYEPRERVRASFRTNYPDLDAFRLDIAKLVKNETDEAVLTGR
jgi:hypothetical protein